MIRYKINAFILASLSSFAYAGPGSVSVGWIGSGPAIESASCLDANRDGVTCYAVGYREGQQGAPWGARAGSFQCRSGCLYWLGLGY